MCVYVFVLSKSCLYHVFVKCVFLWGFLISLMSVNLWWLLPVKQLLDHLTLSAFLNIAYLTCPAVNASVGGSVVFIFRLG